MPLDKSAEKKLAKIESKTKLSGYYKYKNKEEAIETINRYQGYLNDNGTFKKPEIDANCDPNYQQLSAAIDYYKFDVVRPNRPIYGLKKNKKLKIKI